MHCALILLVFRGMLWLVALFVVLAVVVAQRPDSEGFQAGGFLDSSATNGDLFGAGSTPTATDLFGGGSTGTTATDLFGAVPTGTTAVDLFGGGSTGTTAVDLFGGGPTGTTAVDLFGAGSTGTTGGTRPTDSIGEPAGPSNLPPPTPTTSTGLTGATIGPTGGSAPVTPAPAATPLTIASNQGADTTTIISIVSGVVVLGIMSYFAMQSNVSPQI